MNQVKIALSGKMRSGKSSTIQYLLDYYMSHGKSVYITGVGKIIREICSKGFEKIDRETLQVFGTEIVRDGCLKYFGNNDFWINCVISDIKYNSLDSDIILVDNVRYENEFNKLHINGFNLFRLLVTEKEQLEREEDSVCKTTNLRHISETGLDKFEKEDKFTMNIPSYLRTEERAWEILKKIGSV